MKPTTVLQLRSLYQAQARFRKGISVVPTDECTCGKAERLAQRFRTNRPHRIPVGFVGFPIQIPSVTGRVLVIWLAVRFIFVCCSILAFGRVQGALLPPSPPFAKTMNPCLPSSSSQHVLLNSETAPGSSAVGQGRFCWCAVRAVCLFSLFPASPLSVDLTL